MTLSNPCELLSVCKSSANLYLLVATALSPPLFHHVSKIPNNYMNWCLENMSGSIVDIFKAEKERRLTNEKFMR